AGRPDPIAVGICSTVADQVKAQFTLRSFNSSIRLARLWSESSDLRLWIHHGTTGNFLERLFQDLDGFADLQNAHHVTVKDVSVITKRHAKLEAIINAVVVYLADVVVDTRCSQHRSRYTCVHSQVRP